MILDGKLLSETLAGELKQKASGRRIALRVILVGNNPASIKYVDAKQKRAREIGVDCEVVRFDADVTAPELIAAIDGFNNDADVNGIMVQLPLPGHIDADKILGAIDATKDVDGLNPYGSNFMPATVLGIEKLLEHYLFGAGFDLDGKVAVVVGAGKTVGKPAADMLLAHGATVIICHDKTKDLAVFTRQADILVAAAGAAGLITPDHIKDGVIIIDTGAIEGDVSKDCYARAAAYTPVPGGVGPMTVISLMENTIRSAK